MLTAKRALPQSLAEIEMPQITWRVPARNA